MPIGVARRRAVTRGTRSARPKRQRPMSLQEWARTLVWWFGEDRELRAWWAIACTAPYVSAIVSVVILFWWRRQGGEWRWEGGDDTGARAFLWRHCCHQSRVPVAGEVCGSVSIIVYTAVALLAAPLMAIAMRSRVLSLLR